jgi:hypothetical protein
MAVPSGVPGTYANAGHAPGHAPQPTHSISTAPEMVHEGRVITKASPHPHRKAAADAQL